MDGFFDMPAGYSDADLEMHDLEQRGNAYARRYRSYSAAQVADLAAGRTLSVGRIVKATGARYEVRVRATDSDDLGPCAFVYSLDGSDWYPTAKAARLAGAYS